MLGADAFLIAEERLTLIDAGMVGSRIMLERYLRRIGRRIDELETDHLHARPSGPHRRRERARSRPRRRRGPHPSRRPRRAAAPPARGAGAHRRQRRPSRAADPVPDARTRRPDADRGRRRSCRCSAACGWSTRRVTRRAASACTRPASGCSSPATCCRSFAGRLTYASAFFSHDHAGRARVGRAPGRAGRRDDRPVSLPAVERRLQRSTSRAGDAGDRLSASGRAHRGTGRGGASSGPGRNRRARGTRPPRAPGAAPSVVAVTVAVRGEPRRMPISPKTSPGPSVRSSTSRRRRPAPG